MSQTEFFYKPDFPDYNFKINLTYCLGNGIGRISSVVCHVIKDSFTFRVHHYSSVKKRFSK